MTDANAILKYEHLKGLIAGKLKTGNPVRDDLIVSDAERHLAQLISVRLNVNFDGTGSVNQKKAIAEAKIIAEKEAARVKAEKAAKTKAAAEAKKKAEETNKNKDISKEA